jgi:hypothetical protein
LTSIKGLSERARMIVMNKRGYGCQVDRRPISYVLLMAVPPQPARIPMRCGAFLEARRKPMLDLALLSGFALFCLMVVYARLTHRL